MLVLDHTKQEEQLSYLVNAFQEAANKQNSMTIDSQKKTNQFLDDINKRKAYLRSTIEVLDPLLPSLSKDSWFIDPSSRMLDTLKQIIQLMDDLSKVMIRVYARYSAFYTKHGINKDDLRQYKTIADSLKEISVDLNDRFFALPQDEEFNDLMSQLNDL